MLQAYSAVSFTFFLSNSDVVTDSAIDEDAIEITPPNGNNEVAPPYIKEIYF